MGDTPKRIWPEKGDGFPIETSASRGHVPYGFEALDTGEHALAEGFYLAGEVLGKAILNDQSLPAWSGLLHPMLHCFAHYLELTLKEIIPSVAALAKHPVGLNLTKTHNLNLLWKEFRGHCEIALPPHEDGPPTDDIVEKCIADLADIDRGSQATRYATDQKGKRFHDGNSIVDVAAVLGTMTKLHHFFFGCDAYIESLADLQRDVESL